MQEPPKDVNASATPGAALDQAALGTPIAVFKPSIRSRVVIGGCGAVLFAAGLFIAFYPGGQYCYGVFLASTGTIIVFLSFLLGTRRLLIGPGGVIRIDGQKQDSCRWDELREIVVSVPAAGGVKVAYRRCSLVRRDGSRIDLLDLNVGKFETMVDTLRQMSLPHHIPWKDELVTPGSHNDAIVTPDRLDWLRWAIYGLIGFSILMLIIAAIAIYKFG